MPDLFKEIIPSILKTKKTVFETEIDYKDYNPYIVNRALSYHLDCLPYANEMNILNGLDKDIQYQYYLNSIRSMSRKFQTWQKAEVLKDLECVKKFFGYSNEKAKAALRILTSDQLDEIRKITDTGGLNNGRNTKSS
jgi:hypothetical protein